MPRQKLNKRADGRYACKFDGRFFYGKSAAEAMRKRDEYIHECEQGFNPHFADITLYEYGMDWLDAYRSKCNPSQRRQYETFIEYAASHIRAKLVWDVTATDVQRLFNTLDGYSQSHITKFTSTIRSLFRAAVQDGVIIRSPAEMAQPPKGTFEGHRMLEEWEQELIEKNWQGHDFGRAAMVMMYAGLRRGEVLYLDVDRDVDFEKRIIHVRGAVSFAKGNQGTITDGKTSNSQRTIPLAEPLVSVLQGHHGLLCTKEDGSVMTQAAFDRKYESFINYLELQLNGCTRGWYGKKKEHRELLARGEKLPPWREVNIRCHDFRVTFCTMCFNAGIPPKTTQAWMGHADTTLVMNLYTRLTKEKEKADALKLDGFLRSRKAVDYQDDSAKAS